MIPKDGEKMWGTTSVAPHERDTRATTLKLNVFNVLEFLHAILLEKTDVGKNYNRC